MWTTLTYGFLYVYTGMVWNVDGIAVNTNKAVAQAADWILPCQALIERSIATKTTTNTLSTISRTIVQITWENNPTNNYVRSDTTNATVGTNTVVITNFYTNNYLFGKQAYSSITRYNEDNGFEIMPTNTDSFNMINYSVSPLLWGGGLYSASALSNTIPTVMNAYRVSGQAGRYVYRWETNHWPYYATNIVTTNGITTTNVVVMTNGTNIVELDQVFISYNPTNQRPNAITPLMGDDHLAAMDSKFSELVVLYFNDKVADSEGCYDQYCATAGTYWVSGYYVGPIWFESTNITATNSRTYYTTTWNPSVVIQSVVTSLTAGSPGNYTYETNNPIEVAGTEDDHTREEVGEGTSMTPVPGWLSRLVVIGGHWGSQEVSGEVVGTESDHTRVVTNVMSTGGGEGSAEDHNGIKTTTNSVPSSTYESTILSYVGIPGAGLDGEIDFHYAEIAGTEYDYTRRVALSTTLVVSTPYSFTTISNYTEDGTSTHYNRTTSRVRHDRVFIWAGVSNLLAQYMTPWVVDHSNNWTSGNTDYFDTYSYNHGWSPSYNTGWRLYSDSVTSAGLNYFWDWTETNYWRISYQYYKDNYEETAPAFHYPRSYSYYWKYPTSNTYYKNDTWSVPVWISETAEQWYGGVTNYYKNVDNYSYVLEVLTTNYAVTEPLYYIKYQVFLAPPLYTMSSFLNTHASALWGGTNWLLTSAYLTESNSVLSNATMVVTNGTTVSIWTNWYTTNVIITNGAVYSNGWAFPLWGKSFVARYEAFTSLVWTAGQVSVESESRTLTTTNENAEGWGSAPATTNSVNVYSSSISRGGYGSAYTFTKSKIRIRRKNLNLPFNGAIDTYMRFGTTLAGRYDLDELGYPLGPYVRVPELCLGPTDDISNWLGDISTAPSFPDLANFAWGHPYGFTIQNSSSVGVFVFKPTFDP